MLYEPPPLLRQHQTLNQHIVRNIPNSLKLKIAKMLLQFTSITSMVKGKVMRVHFLYILCNEHANVIINIDLLGVDLSYLIEP